MENQSGIKVPSTANFKAKTLVELLDSAYSEHEFVNTNRYSLTFIQKDEENGFIYFEITPIEPVEEAVRTISEERKAELLLQLEKGRATSAAKRIEESEVETSNEVDTLDNSPETNVSPEVNTSTEVNSSDNEEIVLSEV